MRYDELPARARAQVDAALGAPKATRTTRRAAPADPNARYRCHECGAVIARYTAAQRHVDTEHSVGARLDLILS